MLVELLEYNLWHICVLRMWHGMDSANAHFMLKICSLCFTNSSVTGIEVSISDCAKVWTTKVNCFNPCSKTRLTPYIVLNGTFGINICSISAIYIYIRFHYIHVLFKLPCLYNHYRKRYCDSKNRYYGPEITPWVVWDTLKVNSASYIYLRWSPIFTWQNCTTKLLHMYHKLKQLMVIYLLNCTQ